MNLSGLYFEKSKKFSRLDDVLNLFKVAESMLYGNAWWRYFKKNAETVVKVREGTK